MKKTTDTRRRLVVSVRAARGCQTCGHIYDGGVTCPKCGSTNTVKMMH